jgi:acid phosphatase
MKPGSLIGSLAIAVAALLATGNLQAEEVKQHDLTFATLWMQTSVEFQGHALGTYRAAEVMLDRALADKNWTAAPAEQSGDYANKPPAVILDVDETVLDNSAYQVWMLKNGESFNPKSWGKFVNDVMSTPIAGSLEFTKAAAEKGVKIFYVSNRTGDLEEATRKNLEKYGYPMGGNVDTVILKKERPEWKSSKKGVRRAHIAKDYRVLMVMGDNFGDFVDGYKGSVSERQTLFEDHNDMWGTKWIVIGNPSYGSFSSAPFGHNWKKSSAEKRAAILDSMNGWTPKE